MSCDEVPTGSIVTSICFLDGNNVKWQKFNVFKTQII